MHMCAAEFAFDACTKDILMLIVSCRHAELQRGASNAVFQYAPVIKM